MGYKYPAVSSAEHGLFTVKGKVTAQTFLSISVFKKVKQRRPASRQAHFSPGPMYVKGRTDVQIAQ